MTSQQRESSQILASGALVPLDWSALVAQTDSAEIGQIVPNVGQNAAIRVVMPPAITDGVVENNEILAPSNQLTLTGQAPNVSPALPLQRVPGAEEDARRS